MYINKYKEKTNEPLSLPGRMAASVPIDVSTHDEAVVGAAAHVTSLTIYMYSP